MDHAPPLHQTGIGVVAPYDFALDRELWRWVPADVSLHVDPDGVRPVGRHDGDGGAPLRSATLVARGSPSPRCLAVGDRVRVHVG